MLRCLSGRVTALVGVDGWAESLASAARSLPGTALVCADLESRLPFERAASDAAFAFDVLEHVDADRFLTEARRLVRPGGRLLLSVPASPLLFSLADTRAGHRCRYRLSGLKQELDRNGWRLRGHSYYQCLLFPVILASRKLLPNRIGRWERQPQPLAGALLGVVSRLEVAAGGLCRGRLAPRSSRGPKPYEWRAGVTWTRP
jgi:SAM-dependent methyltransferase